MNKKGISPLIATVLLIVFALVIAGMILSWGRGQVTSITDTAGEQVNIELTCSTALQKVGISKGSASDTLNVVNAYGTAVTIAGNYDGEDCTAVAIDSGATGVVTCGSSGSASGQYILTVTTGTTICGPVSGTV